MAEFVFTSPGYKFKERDLTFVTRNVGITTLGLVGETLKGPAFEPVFVQDKNQFSDRFGLQSTKRFSNGNLQYQLPYAANAFLEETNQLWVTRVLGLSGYDAGKAWAITLSAGVDSPVEVSSVTNEDVPFTDNAYLGVTLSSVGATGTFTSGYTKNGTILSQQVHSFTAETKNGTSGTVTDKVTLMTGNSLTEYENMVLAVVRSRAYVVDVPNAAPTTVFSATGLEISGNTTLVGAGDLFGQFVLVASDSDTTVTYKASLNPNSSNFLPNVIGFEPKDKNTKIWVHSIYPDLIKKLDADGIAHGINTTLIECDSLAYTNFKTQFKTPETPWVVSQLKGNNVDRLFKFISISDGDNANQEIKISIVNINPISLEFDVVVRDFFDTDANPKILETFSKCTMIEGQNSYIAQRIGTTDGEYNLMSKYIMVELASDVPLDVFPAGFEGYALNNYAASATGAAVEGIAPLVSYKKAYADDDRVTKTFLGISERGYDAAGVAGTGIDQNLFNFNGIIATETHVNSKGFHMDSEATGVTGSVVFEAGEGKFQTVNDIIDPTNPYFDIKTRKFTFVPAGGFDGWDVHRTSRSYGDFYRLNGIFDGVVPNGSPKNDFQAWETAINTFANPEEVTINLLATPGINWSDQNVLVRNTIEMVETQRTDTLYIIDSPDVRVTVVVGDGGKADVMAAQDVVDLLETAEIDSSYACTYFPWIQMRDTQNNVNVYLAPTGEVAKAMAFTDNTKFPWFAPAGLNRGVTNAKKSKYKLSQEARDILYKGRINPMADFADAGTAIFGQKTLQKKESALDRINVRRLLLQVKVLIANIAIRLVFEQDDQSTIDQFLAKTNPVLASIKRERGLQDFKVKMDDTLNTPETHDRNELYGDIYLKPTRALEYIGINFVITPSGASFADSGA